MLAEGSPLCLSLFVSSDGLQLICRREKKRLGINNRGEEKRSEEIKEERRSGHRACWRSTAHLSHHRRLSGSGTTGTDTAMLLRRRTPSAGWSAFRLLLVLLCLRVKVGVCTYRGPHTLGIPSILLERTDHLCRLSHWEHASSSSSMDLLAPGVCLGPLNTVWPPS